MNPSTALLGGRRAPLRFAVAVALMATALNACEGPTDRPAGAPMDALERTAYPITGGVNQSIPWFAPTMESEFPCSAVMYKRRWVLTTAHCFPETWDFNPKDGKITAAEIKAKASRGAVFSGGGPDIFGRSVSYTALNIYKPQGTKWDVGLDSGNNDIALVELSGDFYPEALAGFRAYFHMSNGVPVLNLDQWPTNTLAPTSWVDNYGWAHDGLQHAVGAVTSSSVDKYVAGPLNNAGVTMSGDSGGPGFWLGTCVWGSGNCYYTTGLHSGGGEFTSTETSINMNKAWIETVAGK